MKHASVAAIQDHIAASAALWPEPDARIINGGARSAPAFPTSLLGSMGDYVASLAASKGSPIDYMAVAVLGAVAGATGGARLVQPRPGWNEVGALWLMSVGEPSSGKSQPTETIKRHLLDIEREEALGFDETRRTYETQKKCAELVNDDWEARAAKAAKDGLPIPIKPETADLPEEPAKPRIVIGNSTVEATMRLFSQNPRGLIQVDDELSRWFGDFGRYGGGGDVGYYLSTFNGISVPVDRVKAGAIKADRALLSIVGCIQPERLHEQLFAGRANDGLISRFLMVWPDPIPAVWEVPEVDERRLRFVLDRLRGLSMGVAEDGRTVPVTMALDQAATNIFRPWWLENKAKARQGSSVLADFRGKGDGIVARLALALELMEWADEGRGPPPSHVGARSVAAAAGLFEDYFIPMALRVYGDAAHPPAERLAVTLLKELRKRGVLSFNARVARRTWGLPGLSQIDPMRSALSVLEEADCIVRAPGEREGAGRKPEDYIVNPHIDGGADV